MADNQMKTENRKEKIKIVFMGTPEFGAVILEKLCRSEYKPVLAVTAPDKPAGRKLILTPPPVKITAQKYGIPIIQPEKISSLKPEISDLKPDLIIVASFGRILPKGILELPKYGCLNLHPSLLPQYRGATPIQSAVLDGCEKTGATVILMDEKMDHGPIVAQKTLVMEKQETAVSLFDKLAELSADLILETIPKWLGNEIKARKQDESRATFTRILTKENGRINWRRPAEEIERKIRAFNPWPGTYCLANDKIFKILKAGVLKQTENGPFGSAGKTYLASNDKIAVQTGQDFLIIKKLQLAGKKETVVADFLKGHLNFIGTVLE
ncbi:MAG TPA: methionyl-tRNA formyltransferase [Patescibacteria group bacterium]|nr:methionyl-tRNA formyltransferase [Patescibacteria group bacterium]